MRLAGKTAVITGAARGQGRAHAVRLAQEGADIVAIDICANAPGIGYPLSSREDLDETVRLVEEADRRCFAMVGDVTDASSLETVLSEASTAGFDAIDVIVANAAICSYAKLLDTDWESWSRLIDTNLSGVFNTVSVFGRRMVEGGRGGSIVMTGSTAGIKGLPFCGAYAAAKHGVHGLMKVWAQELGEFGIRVNTIDPGPVNTIMANDPTGPVALSGGAETADSRLFLTSFQPILPLPDPGMIPPEKIASVVAWLASDDAAFVTGISVPIDGGVAVR